ncbi:hypothetical protein, partial [Candidatus Hakubella thermalkaliphila]|uniref:hypothetical protein n=1 Tax=Candidatus Hakubella thermalkaliphila TaxID=2754717 RepID=UPI001C61181A
ITKGILHNYPCFYDYPTNSFPQVIEQLLRYFLALYPVQQEGSFADFLQADRGKYIVLDFVTVNKYIVLQHTLTPCA